ncbi:MAG TPA: alpha/beta hydrolase [Afifellaceae bacterium]|nr:alpha/beta hydrolase [Afifellaceae bacterium]
MTQERPVQFTGVHGNAIFGEETGPEHGIPVLLLHGGGQTRHAWRNTGRRLGMDGFRSICIDQRGHGDSAWDSAGRYTCDDFAADLRSVADAIRADSGRAPAAVGASLGGIATMLVAGSPPPDLLSAAVLVDITPTVSTQGVDRITGFMRANARAGFGSLAEAADAVASYLPHRPKPGSTAGLMKNLRRRDDGRYVWHWDPQVLDGPHPVDTMAAPMRQRMMEATCGIAVPLLLVRGSLSELVEDSHVEEFRWLAPHAEVADVRDAGHMVAGDRNDVFSDAVAHFLNRYFRGRDFA